MTAEASRAEEIVARARAWIGTPYRHQASRKGVGCDCLGLVRGVWRAVCGAEPEVVPDVWGAAGRAPRPAVAIARTAASAAPDVALPTIVCILADSQT